MQRYAIIRRMIETVSCLDSTFLSEQRHFARMFIGWSGIWEFPLTLLLLLTPHSCSVVAVRSQVKSKREAVPSLSTSQRPYRVVSPLTIALYGLPNILQWSREGIHHLAYLCNRGEEYQESLQPLTDCSACVFGAEFQLMFFDYPRDMSSAASPSASPSHVTIHRSCDSTKGFHSSPEFARCPCHL